MATVLLIMELQYDVSFKESRVLSWKQQSMLFWLNQRSMARTLTQLFINWSDGHKKDCNMQSILIVKTRNQLAKLKVMAFIGEIECKK